MDGEKERLVSQANDDSGDGLKSPGRRRRRRQRGIGVAMATVILVAELVGSGMLALPRTLVGTGLGGLGFIVFFSFSCTYIGTRIAKCWEILAATTDEFRSEPGYATEISDPYPLMAFKAGQKYSESFGRLLRLTAILCIIFTLYGIGCIYLLLISNFLTDLSRALDTCHWLLITTALLTPLTWFQSPKDSWHLAIMALVSALATGVLIVAQTLLLENEGSPFTCRTHGTNSTIESTPHFPAPTVSGFLAAFGTMQYSFSGISTFPTVHADMANKAKFKFAVMANYLLLIFVYSPVMAVTYLAFGDCVKEDIIKSLTPGHITTACQILMMIHLITIFPIMINAPNQYLEQLLNISGYMVYRRITSRTLVMILLLFLAVTVPSFGSILNLVGSSTATLLTYVFPGIFYISLNQEAQKRTVWAKAETVVCLILILIFLFGGVLASGIALAEILVTDFRRPCYLQ